MGASSLTCAAPCNPLTCSVRNTATNRLISWVLSAVGVALIDVSVVVLIRRGRTEDHQAAPPEHQAKSQGLYWVLGYGLGGGIGGLAAGALWPHGQMLAAFGLSCAAALLGWLCALRWPTSVQQARTMPSA